MAIWAVAWWGSARGNDGPKLNTGIRPVRGVKTNIVTAVEVDERYAGDCPRFRPLLDTTARSFRINEVSADCAYSSYENLDAVAAHGGTPFIAYKANANPKGSGMYEKMFHYYSCGPTTHREVPRL
jgi:hypothetical protein